MKLYITFGSKQKISLPTHYNHIMQGAILNWIGEEAYQKFIHDIGYEYEGRKFKLFTFSKLMGKYDLTPDKKEVIFQGKVKLVISSCQERFITELEKSLRDPSKEWRLGRNNVKVISINKEEEPLVGNCITVRSLSPIVAYNTLLEGEKKKTQYYSPLEVEFENILRQNVIKKYHAIFEKEGSTNHEARVFTAEDFCIKPLKPKQISKSIVYYKGFIIVGFNGQFEITGDPALLQLALEAGLGGKNAQGFGLIQLLRH